MMKKITLMIVLSLWTIISFSQTWAAAVNLTIGIRDNKYSKFTWGETKPVSDKLLIKLEGSDVIVYTEEIQFYQTLKPEYKTDDGNGSYWYAVDEEMKRCKVYLYYKNGNVLMIEYDDVCIIYGIIYR
jgi:hypothetical protein